jgi:hypothetical protein
MKKFYGVLAILFCLFAAGTFIPATQNIATGAVLLTLPLIFILGIARFWKDGDYPNRRLLSIISSVSLLLIIITLFLLPNYWFWDYIELSFFIGLGLLGVAVAITLFNSFKGKVSLSGAIDKIILIFPLAIYATFGILQFNYFTDVKDIEKLDELSHELVETQNMILNFRTDSTVFAYQHTFDLMTQMFLTVAEYSGGFQEGYVDVKLHSPNKSIDQSVEREWLNKIRASLNEDIQQETDSTAKQELQRTLDEIFYPNALGTSALETRLRLYIGQTRLAAINELKN